MTRWSLLVLALLADPLRAQVAPGIVFDDFSYQSAEWSSTLAPVAAGAPIREDSGPPAGSLYGPNRWATADGLATHRLWYKYAWQEHGASAPARTLRPTATGIRFAVAPGRHHGDGCPSPDDSTRIDFPQQIATGFAARRGTWAARVRFGPMGPPDRLAMMQAFWLIAPMSGFVRQPDGTFVRVTNEIDHEFNNRFLGSRQTFPYDATGVFRAELPHHISVPLYAPAGQASPSGDGEPWPDGLAWSCRVDLGGRSRRLGADACGRLLTDRPNPADPDLGGPVDALLRIHVADSGVSFGLTAEGSRGRLVMVSDRLERPTDLPLVALFSHHLYPGGENWTCDGLATVDVAHSFDVDWFLYTPDAAATEAEIVSLVERARQAEEPRVATVAGLRLERPDRPLWGPAARYGFGGRTTPLNIDLHVPAALRPGETTRLVALPPLREGGFRLEWSTVTHHRDGRRTTDDVLTAQAFAAPFTFPAGADSVVVRVLLTEVDDTGREVRNEVVHPVQRTATIRRR